MNYSTKHILFLIIAAITSCKTNNKPEDNLVHIKATPSISWETKQFLRDSLFKWFQKKYQLDVEFYGGTYVKIDSSEGQIKLNIIGEDNEETLSPITIIPEIKNFIEGDLNHDGFNDLIISIYYNQAARPRLRNYCYITKNSELRFYKVFSIHELGICENITDTSGRFFPGKIENGRLVGQTDCLQNGDPGCCPSLEYISYFTFDNGFKFEKNVIKDSSRVRH